MADLKPLIRYRGWQVDEKRRIIAALYEEAYVLEQQKTGILDTMARETEAARTSGSFDALRMLGTYVKGARARIVQIDQYAQRLDLRIQLAQDDLREHFAELKKIEILHGNRLAAERARNERREEELMNEIGLTIYGRNKVENGEL